MKMMVVWLFAAGIEVEILFSALAFAKLKKDWNE